MAANQGFRRNAANAAFESFTPGSQNALPVYGTTITETQTIATGQACTTFGTINITTGTINITGTGLWTCLSQLSGF